MGLSVKLEAFEGPLDLLLNLIEKNKVNIYDKMLLNAPIKIERKLANGVKSNSVS